MRSSHETRECSIRRCNRVPCRRQIQLNAGHRRQVIEYRVEIKLDFR